MNNDVIARARRVLESKALRNDKSAVDRVPNSTAIARARALLEPPAQHVHPAVDAGQSPVAESRVERVNVPVSCSKSGAPSVAIFDRCGLDLRYVGHEMPPAGASGEGRMPERLSGQYRIDMKGWACPHCGAAEDIWLCDCERMNGAMHCMGSSGGRYRCACGRAEARAFERVAAVEVRGASVAATPERTRSGFPPAQTQRKQVTHDRSR